MNQSRRTLQRVLRITALVAAFTVVLAACSAPDEGGGLLQGGGGDVIRIGLLRPITGPVAAPGKDMEEGWNLYWKQHGNVVAGKRVETITEDTAGNPSIALNKANQLVENAKVQVVVGPLLANVGLAVADLLNRKKVPVVMPIVSADDLTQRKRYPYVLRFAGWTSSQPNHPLGEWAYDQGYRNVVTLCADYAFGYETCGGFVNTFTDKGGKILKQLWAPLGTQDYSSYMTQIRQANPDVVFVGTTGADAVRVLQTWKDFGLKGKIPLLGNATLTDQNVLRNIEGDAAEGIISTGHFAEGRDDPATQAFVDAYLKEYGKVPSFYSADMYAAAQGIAQAIERMKGDLSDPVRFIETLRGVDLDNSPLGPQEMDRYGNPVLDIYLRRVEKGPEGYWNVPIQTFKDVSQFWNYGPEEFLKNPVYSKTYQGADVWKAPGS